MKGNLEAGTIIPSVRKMALELSITPGTVAKAYQELERQGIIETIRGKGTFIALKIEKKPDEEKVEQISKEFQSKIIELKMMGYDEEHIVELIRNLYREMS